MMKLLELWSTLGLKVMSGYIKAIDNVGAASIIFVPFMLLGFTIPWAMVYVVLIGLNIIQGWFVYDLTFKEQFDCVKEGFIEGVNVFRKM
jgi:multidrug transporter EmrE-like cation transporter